MSKQSSVQFFVRVLRPAVHALGLMFVLAGVAHAQTGEVIVDNTSANVQYVGTWVLANSTVAVGGNYRHDAKAGKGTKEARFALKVAAAGRYKVYLRWVGGTAAYSTAVPVNVVHSAGSTRQNIDQSKPGTAWTLLGTFAFAAGGGSVVVANAGTTGFVTADAVRYLPDSVAPPPPPPPGDAQLKDAARLLAQASYGPTTAAIKDAAAKGSSKWIDDQFLLAPVSHYNVLRAIEVGGTPLTSIDETPLMGSIWKRAIEGPDQLRQRVAFALSEIFVVSFRDGDLASEEFAFASYMDMLARNAFGNFRTLLEEVTLHPAMGYYLDMLRSEKEDPATGRQPNENFAREVLQLFSIGLNQLNPDGSVKLDAQGKPIPTYDQDVILGFAKAFSGWSLGVNPKTDDGFYWDVWPRVHPMWITRMQPYASKHSPSAKLLLNGVTLAAGGTPQADLKAALDSIFNHPNVGPFIGKQLIQRLVTSNPSPGYVSRVAAKFNNNGAGVRGDMKAVIKAILMDTEARSPAAALGVNFGKQREPIVRLANLVRAFKGKAPNGTFPFWYTQIIDYGLGQQFFFSPSVFNFYQPDYTPQGPVANAKLVAPEFQITTDSQLLGSSNTLYALINWGYGFQEGQAVNLNYAEFIPAASDPAKLVTQLDLLMTGGLTSSTTRNAIVAAVTAEPAANAAERVKKAVYLFAVSPDYAIQK